MATGNCGLGPGGGRPRGVTGLGYRSKFSGSDLNIVHSGIGYCSKYVVPDMNKIV